MPPQAGQLQGGRELNGGTRRPRRLAGRDHSGRDSSKCEGPAVRVLSLPRKAGARWAQETIAEIREVVRGQILRRLEYGPPGPGQGDVREGV